MDDETAAVAVQYPNFYGSIEDLKRFIALLKIKSIIYRICKSISIGITYTQVHLVQNIVVGDTQPFGIPAQFGGPHCGYFATTKKLMRKVPGRLVGQTQDDEGNRGFVLTLQARNNIFDAIKRHLIFVLTKH